MGIDLSCWSGGQVKGGWASSWGPKDGVVTQREHQISQGGTGLSGPEDSRKSMFSGTWVSLHTHVLRSSPGLTLP